MSNAKIPKTSRRYVFTDHECVCCEDTIGFCQDYMIVEGEYVCPTCYEEQTFRCTCCMEHFFNDEACYDEEEFPYCRKCFEAALRADEYEYDEEEEEDDDEELTPADIAG